jgi:hypothetical protein
MAVNLDNAFNKTEQFLTRAAAIPVIGTPFGAVKVVIGTLQAITALVLGIITSPLQATEDSSFNDHCWTHLRHGLGNFAAGLLEAIPLVGTFLYYARENNVKEGIEQDGSAGQRDKFMPYSSLRHKAILEGFLPSASNLQNPNIMTNLHASFQAENS